MDRANDRLERVDVREKPRPAGPRDAHERGGPPRPPLPRERDDLHFGERVQVTVQVAVGQAAGIGECCEREALAVGDEASADGEPSALVKDAIEALVSEGR